MATREPVPQPQTWVWVWGVQCWLVWVLGPRAYRDDGVTLQSAAWALLPLALLTLLWVRHRRASHLAPSATLLLYPATLALSLCNLPADLALATYGPAVLAVGSLSLLAFAASASRLSSRPVRLRPGAVQPLGESHVAATDPRRARLQLALLASTSGAFIAWVVFGSWDTALRYHEAWGASAAAGATLTAITAGLIGSVAMAAIVGPSLRAERPSPSGAQGELKSRKRRVAWLLSVALSGMVVYAVLVGGR